MLIFTDFVPTQAIARWLLQDRGMSVVCLNGSRGLEERKESRSGLRRLRIMIPRMPAAKV